MGASPQQKALDAAKQSVAEAQKQQQKLYQDIKGRSKTYSKKAMGQLETLEGAAGTTLPDYISAVKQQFGNIPTIEATQQKYEQALQNFDPGLIGSASDQRLRQSLMQSAQPASNTRSSDTSYRYLTQGLLRQLVLVVGPYCRLHLCDLLDYQCR